MKKISLRLIAIVSVIIPLAVAVLIFSPLKTGLGDLEWIRSLPMLHALINSLTALLLIGAAIAIKSKKVELHRDMMVACFFLGSLFLASYILYHSSVATTIFGDINGNGVLDDSEMLLLGNSRTIYLVVLLSHIGFSIVVVPFVLMAFYFALSDQIEKHKKIVKFTYPIWLYVSVTGVIVYMLISPYYQQ